MTGREVEVRRGRYDAAGVREERRRQLLQRNGGGLPGSMSKKTAQAPTGQPVRACCRDVIGKGKRRLQRENQRKG